MNRYTVAVVARNLEDYKYWVKEHKLQFVNSYTRWATDGKKYYIGITLPNHAIGYTYNDIITTNIAFLNKNYTEIMNYLKPCLIKQKKTNWFVKLFKKIFGCFK